MEDVLIKINGYEKYFTENKDIYSIQEILSRLEDLYFDVERLEEELKGLEQDIEDNYRPIPISEQVGISDRDFY